jgi:hypothetical protein
MSGGDHFVARLNANRQQSQQQRPGAGGNANGVFRANGRGQRPFKVRHFLTQDKTGAVNDALNGRINLRLDAGILSF